MYNRFCTTNSKHQAKIITIDRSRDVREELIANRRNLTTLTRAFANQHMPISGGFKGWCEEVAHRDGLIPSEGRIFRVQRRLFLFLTQLEDLQKMFTLVKEHCWPTPCFSWQAGAFQPRCPPGAGEGQPCPTAAAAALQPPQRVHGGPSGQRKHSCTQASSCCAPSVDPELGMFIGSLKNQ